MKVSLVVAQGKRHGKVLPISVPQFVIGRHKECQLIASGSTISQHHCAVLVRDGKVFVRDFDSTNGTFVNQKRVNGEQELASEDLLQLGRLAFRVQIEEGEEEPAVPDTRLKTDESFIGEMLLDPGDIGATEGFLGLLEDSKCGSTIMRSPQTDDEPSDPPPPTSDPDKAPEPVSEPEKEESPLPSGPSDEIAKKLLDELHRSVRAKHNRPDPT